MVDRKFRHAALECFANGDPDAIQQIQHWTQRESELSVLVEKRRNRLQSLKATPQFDLLAGVRVKLRELKDSCVGSQGVVSLYMFDTYLSQFEQSHWEAERQRRRAVAT